MNEDEWKWFFLFQKGIHKSLDDDEYDTNINLGFDAFSQHLNDFNLEDFSTGVFKMFGIKIEQHNEQHNEGEEHNKQEHDEEEEHKNDTKDTNNVVALLSTYFPFLPSKHTATDMISITEFIFCLQTDKRPTELVRAFADCVLAHKNSIHFGKEVCLLANVKEQLSELTSRAEEAEEKLTQFSSEMEERMKVLATPTKKKEKKKLTEEEQREKLDKLKKKRDERCAEMGVGSKKIPIGNIMEGLKRSVKRIQQEVKSSEVLSNYFLFMLQFITPFF